MKSLERQQQLDKIASLWLGGVTSARMIAKAVGVDRGVVRRALVVLKREWAAQQDGDREHNRAVALARLDRLTMAFASDAHSGNPQAANVLLGIEKHRAQLLGTAEPTRIDQRLSASVSVGPSIDEMILHAHEGQQEQATEMRAWIEQRTAPSSAERALVLEAVAMLMGPGFLHMEEPRLLSAPEGL